MRRFLKVFVLSSLACSQIWLIPLVGDHQYGHITKVQTKKKKKQNKKPVSPTTLKKLMNFLA